VKKPLAVIVAVVKGDAAQSVYYCGAFVVFGGVGMGRSGRNAACARIEFGLGRG
jgi:hypothetical protein